MLAVGTMSGTSLDGVDAAVIETDGVSIFGFHESAYRPYSRAERHTLRNALGRWPGEPGVAEAAEVVEAVHLELLQGFSDAELIGFHGQTLAHDPGGLGTHQAGNGAGLAEALHRPVVWDFRSSDVALGGQGAPLAPFFHWACARWAGLRGPVVFLNLGGVGNLTWTDPTAPAPEVPGACLAFDTGPANAPLDDLMSSRGLGSYDKDGVLAASGRVDEGVVAEFLADPYFTRPAPKSLDRNAFTALSDAVAHLPDADALATLTECAAASVAAGLRGLPQLAEQVFVTGGGRRNPELMAAIERQSGLSVAPVEGIGLSGDMLEAQAFGYLAVRVTQRLPTSCPGTTGVAAAVGGGKVSRPG